MATPTPAGDPFAEAVGEAVQTSTMAVRLIVTIADAVRRAAEKRAAGKEKELPPSDQAVPEAAGELKSILPADIATALMTGEHWPQMAQQLMALQRAGVDMAQFLPRVGEIAVTVQDAVTANTERIAREGTEEWSKLLRETMPAGPVREAIVSSPAWPDIAATMGQLQERGVDVRQPLVAAHAEGAGVDQAVARVMAAGAKPVVPLSRDAERSYGPLTVGLDIPKDLDLSNRQKALAQLGVIRSENERYTRWVREAMADRGREAGLLLTARQWPLVAAQMAQMEGEGTPVQEHLARLMRDTSWEKGPSAQMGSRLVQAANEALRRPLGEKVDGTAMRVSTAAAKAQSVTTAGPTSSQAKTAAPDEPAVVPHRTPAPAPQAGRRR
jgi:hypothetical protein